MPRSKWMYLHPKLVGPLSYFITERNNAVLTAERVQIKDYRLTTILKMLYPLLHLDKSMFHDDLFLQSYIRNSTIFNNHIKLCLHYGLITSHNIIEQKHYTLTESGKMLLDIFLKGAKS